MDSAARQWFLIRQGAAHTCGPCAGTVQVLVAKIKEAMS